MKGSFHAAPEGQKSKQSSIVIGMPVGVKVNLTGATQDLSPIGIMKRQDSRQPCPRGTRAYQPEEHSNCQSPKTIGPTPDAGL